MLQYWYNNKGKQDGPYFLDELLKFNLSASTLIYRSDKDNWLPKSTFHELNEFKISSDFSGKFILTDKSTIKEMGYINIPYDLWKWSLIILAVSFSLTVIGAGLENFDIAQVSFVAFVLAFIVSNIFNYVLLYRNWKIIQFGNVRTTPSKAVGFCFIPLFNMYWIFEAFYGLSLDQQKYLKEDNIESSIIPKPLYSKIACISALVSLLIPVGIIPTVIFGIIAMNNQKKISQSILKYKSI